MHELGICEGLVDLIERRAAGRRVTGARVRVGARHAVTEKAFGQAFAIASEGTAAAGAAVDVVITPASADCRACGRWSETLDPVAACAYCGATDVEVSGGDELVLESLRFAEPGWRTAAPGEAPVPGEGEHRVSRHPR